MAEEEREQQGTDVASVHVGVGHQDDFPVTQLGGIEVFLRDAGAERGNHGADFFVAKHLVVTRFFDVENLSLQWEDRLETAIAALLGCPACGLALNQEQFAALRLPFAAIC